MSEKVTNLIEEVKSLTVLELSELVKALEEEFGVSAAAPVAVAAAPAAGGAGDVVAPMPGTVLKVNVNNGDTVASGDVILILEAMKMENEIVAPCAGTVTLNVKAGETVDTDAVLASVQ